MIRLSPGILNSVLTLLNLIDKFSEISLNRIKAHSMFNGIHVDDVIETSLKCEWLICKENHFFCTEAGQNLLELYLKDKVTDHLLRRMIRDYIYNCSPIWANRIPNGRKEAFYVMSIDEQKCFVDSNLMKEPPEKTIIDWWDEVSQSIRYRFNSNLLGIGRQGELLTLEYELKRTGVSPILQSLNTNLVGYDILSQVGEKDTQKLLIEVKSSLKNAGTANFVFTKNEWETACQTENYLIYLWEISTVPRLAIVAPLDMFAHIPLNQGYGKWIKTEVPFYAFEDKFVDVNQ
ncbi:DUF3883 domain-containing protein [Desulforamulus ruminis]|uniref:Protein NO VEIN C-terminal domain-containing protein n=1 Tax=Desulforamulus ruminis (strain ATCC 23193 / DSM 2154 / NCIMB 8452 / DL) TaxID=696281 RepID=F6DQU8_DESRL|nr:DUF3883 domain-containing protein [Desulforamulus ruminis]AEG58672.1 hypothetical protein Desru_0375 [Desulforamulus ruminis DSM 2154]